MWTVGLLTILSTQERPRSGNDEAVCLAYICQTPAFESEGRGVPVSRTAARTRNSTRINTMLESAC